MKKFSKFCLIIILLALPFCVWGNNYGDHPSGSTDYSSENTLTNPISTSDPNELIGQVISAVLGVVGSLALLMFIYGGLVWMTAAGNNEKVQKGKNVLIWATIGLMVIFSSYAMVRFVIEGLATGGG